MSPLHGFKPDPKPKARVRLGLRLRRRKPRTIDDRIEQASWRAHVLAHTTPIYTRTAVETAVDLQAHHAVPRSACRKYGAPEWDRRNGVAVSKRRHARHHSRHEPILREELPAAVFAFAREHELSWWLLDHYPTAVAA